MAYVLSSVSGNLISAASAGFAPTNSADVSAIASSYQVVSATGTQTYAGTAYVTSVNEAPLSAARAGNAANAVLATSAWYDGTGRLLSSLPDEATVSSIASAYQVVSSVGTSRNGPKSIVTGINGLFISARYADTANEARKDSSGRMISSLPDSAAVSAIASAYAESAASSKLDSSASSSFYGIDNPSGFLTTAYTPTFGYNTADQISSIDGSALGGMDEAAVSGIASAYAESAVSAASSNYYTTANESGFLTAQVQASWSESASASPSYIVDKPDLVDIVAGPGIVVDNPDGNTLRVSVAQAEEVVLYDAGDSPSQAGPWQISEARTNFEWVDIVFGNDSTGSMKQVTRFAADSAYMKLHLPRYDEEPSYKWSTMTLSWAQRTASIKTNSVGRFTIASNGSVSVSTAASQAPYLFQIVGIHRIANN